MGDVVQLAVVVDDVTRLEVVGKNRCHRRSPFVADASRSFRRLVRMGRLTVSTALPIARFAPRSKWRMLA
jgi:hypothetical protein